MNSSSPTTLPMSRDRRTSWTGSRPILLLAFVAVTLCCLNGCIFRRMTIRSNPPGALVLLDGREVGYTPVAVDFTYYGTREIQLVKPGFETKTVLQEVPPPWYQVPPLDFFADNLTPFKVTNRHEFMYTLNEQKFGATDDLLNRANTLRGTIRSQ